VKSKINLKMEFHYKIFILQNDSLCSRNPNIKAYTQQMVDEIIKGLKDGDIRMLSRAISLVEDGDETSEKILNHTFKEAGTSYRIGVTGPPGAGKSTIVSKLVKFFRNEGKKVGIVAVDPTSPFSGGAVLGDRIRMNELTGDEGVFIRSMATRGSLGGLSNTAQDVGDLMAVTGFDIVVFETVGVGQGELDVAQTSDTTVVVLVPESGDSIQAMKAGLMEIADVFVINKADREGAERMKIELEMMLQLRTNQDKWQPPILKTIAQTGEGIDELKQIINKHSAHLVERGFLKSKRSRRLQEKIRLMILAELQEGFWSEKRKEYLFGKLSELMERKITPRELIMILKNMTD
jgi:LAO/AO transport system kinase